jgi:hypothetical protein
MSDPYATIEITRKVIMTLEEMMNDADAKAFFAEMAELDAMPLLKGGYCPSCEWSQNNCHCVEYGLPLPE